ncbi:hypothetical protein NEMIN01_0309 [Nematocida minor]|uniref:uncharacterized protein n=1 Tax=Nematocida minor TaxID=1912983 RepID=UPI00222053CD|nr:uncharacterized protein NEMIN01_0309 [Nematocida minor]KAI5189143.1 hypothetical protein NEMIN01_0309 [Nematocida minor]
MTDIKNRHKNQIYWHKRDIKIELESWSSDEVDTATNIYAPGPKTEPPFEVSVVSSRFLYENNKESTLYVIRIGSLMHSWLLLKSIQEIVDLIVVIKNSSDILDKLSIKRFRSIGVDNYQERYSIIQLVLSTLLNNSIYYKHIQQFILSSTMPNTDSIKKISDILDREREAGVYLVEYKGWISRWKVHYYQLVNNIIVNTSVKTGRVKRVVDIKDIKIVDRVVKIDNKELIAQDSHTVEIIKKWMHQCIS